MNTNAPIDTLLRHGRFYLHHHTPKRAKNFAHTMHSLLRRPIHAPNMPISLKVEPSAMCQLRCPGCAQSSPLFKVQTKGKVMQLPLFEHILDQLGDCLYRIQFYDLGEPFLNKELLTMISMATNRYNIGSQVSTNFSFPFSDQYCRDIVESGLEHLIIAMDGVDAPTYSAYRVGGRFELVEQGMRQIVRWKRQLGLRYPIVEWQFIVFEHNRHVIERAKRMAKEIGVDRFCLKYDAASVPSDFSHGDRLKLKALRRIHLKSCLWLWGSVIIDSEGLVRPCCNAGRIEVLGDMRSTPFSDIWNSESMKYLRACVRTEGRQNRSSNSPCAGCPHIM
jgi:MoaA/NifB/PqqE/SkfB family radical SAM enzyme